MKKLIFTIFILTLLVLPSFAITVEQLDQANEILTQMDRKIAQLRGYVQIARDGKVGEIILTAAQKQELKDRYLNEKAELVALYNQLP